jgi:hypothetical protein
MLEEDANAMLSDVARWLAGWNTALAALSDEEEAVRLNDPPVCCGCIVVAVAVVLLSLEMLNCRSVSRGKNGLVPAGHADGPVDTYCHSRCPCALQPCVSSDASVTAPSTVSALVSQSKWRKKCSRRYNPSSGVRISDAQRLKMNSTSVRRNMPGNSPSVGCGGPVSSSGPPPSANMLPRDALRMCLLSAQHLVSKMVRLNKWDCAHIRSMRSNSARLDNPCTWLP